MAFNLASGSGGDDDNTDQMAEINIIPLVDVMLVLLIIFMVTAPLSIGGINVNLPLSRAKGVTVTEDRVVLSIAPNGRYFIEKMEVTAAALDERFKAIYQHRKKKELYIRADKGVIYGKVVDAMAAAKLAGVTKISMLTQVQDAPKR